MLSMLSKWQGTVDINGVSYDNIHDARMGFKNTNKQIHIVLYPQGCAKPVTTEEQASNPVMETPTQGKQYKITVRQYMTKKSSPQFDFMAKWNNDVPMPMRTMVGTILQETKGMVKMQLHADILQERTLHCMCCGRQITNPVSQYFGMGPECGGHHYTHPFDTDEELKAAVESYRKELQNITWTGWIIKSAIESKEVI